MDYFNWKTSDLVPGPPYDRESPNVRANLNYALFVFGGQNLGTYVVRPITGGTNWSTHAFGAANDWGYGRNRQAALNYIDFLIANHELLGVQMIVDENYDRTWKCSRPELGGKPGWKSSPINGGTWLHIETHPDFWTNATPIATRLHIQPPPIPPTEITLEDNMKVLKPAPRAYDTRNTDGPMRAGETRTISTGRTEPAAMINIVAVQPGGDGYLVVWDVGAMPSSSVLNFTTGETVANAVIVPVAPNGTVKVFASVACHLIMDVQAVWP